MKKILLFLISLTPFVCISQVPQKITFTINSGIRKGAVKQAIELNTTNLLVKINEGFSNNVGILQLSSNLTENGKKAVNAYWKDNGHFYCYVDKLSENLLTRKISPTDSTFQIRNIPIVFGNGDTVDVVIVYLLNGKIDDFYIGLSLHQYKRVMDGTGVINETRRQLILEFLETFRNYYIKKDIGNIEKLYSEEALIIIGKVLKPVDEPMDHIKSNFTKAQIQYIVRTKAEYLKKLKDVFDKTSYLLIDFDSIHVAKHRKYPNFYGILLQQTWKSSIYDDKGWLFLLVQFREEKELLIWIRTWQDVIYTPLNDIFGMHNFIIQGDGKVRF